MFRISQTTTSACPELNFTFWDCHLTPLAQVLSEPWLELMRQELRRRVSSFAFVVISTISIGVVLGASISLDSAISLNNYQ